MLTNTFMALTNLVALPSIIQLFQQTRYVEFFVVFGAAISSFIYHLIEHHKHGMPGIGYFDSRFWHIFFLNMDRVFAFLTVIILAYYNPNAITKKRIIFTGLIALVFMTLSETLYRPVRYQKQYIILHTIWHIMAYTRIHLVINS